MKYVVYFILIAVAVFFVKKFLDKFKLLNFSCISVFSGDVKTGKSTIGLHSAYSKYKRLLFRWKIKCFFRKLFKKSLPEKPLFYSNIPVGWDYVPLTFELINREERFRFGSVLFVDEANLLADSTSALGQSMENKTQNERIQIFSALFGHETHGGYLFYTCHNLERLHFGIRDVCSQYFYIHHLTKWVPFFMIAHIREKVVGANTINVDDKDIELNLRKVIIPKFIWKRFDCYAYSFLTDDLPVADKVIEGAKLPNLKAKTLISFKNWHAPELVKFFKNKKKEIVLDEKKDN